jgi:short subunit dehydrogenase-like uncharacterized protein
MTQRGSDLVVFGATSFVGQLLCRYLTRTFGVNGPLTWAAAGRSQTKLETVRAALGPAAKDLPLILADAGDEAALAEMCRGTRAVVSTVGPYALYGEPLVRICAEGGTDYCDLTGEVPWIDRMIERYENAAKASGARIVHCCGFDSLPSDLGVYFMQNEARARFGEPLARIKMRVRAMRGGASGGTIASMMNIAEEMAANPSLRRRMANPYSLVPKADAPNVRQPSLSAVAYDPDFRRWQAPFVMAGINTRVVHRSNALSGFAYGRDFLYDEAMLMGDGMRGRMRAYGLAGGLGAFVGGAAFRPTRWLLQRFVPAPGEGPSPEQQQKGFFDFRFVGRTADGRMLRGKVAGQGDPGYGSTSKMLGQAAACLVLDTAKEEKSGGFWTPATIFGDRLIERLRAHADVTFEIEHNQDGR